MRDDVDFVKKDERDEKEKGESRVWEEQKKVKMKKKTKCPLAREASKSDKKQFFCLNNKQTQLKKKKNNFVSQQQQQQVVCLRTTD